MSDVFRFRIAEQGSPDLDRWLELRTTLYLESGLINDDQVDANGMYVDQYDDYSTHLLASDDAGVDIGCCRIIEPQGDQTLPVTDLFGIEPLPRSYEASGVAVLPRYRKALVSLGMYRAIADLADQKGYEYSYSIVEEPVLAALRGLGYPIRVLSEPLFVFNAPNVAAVIDRNETLAAMEKFDSALSSLFLRYYRKPFEWSLTESDLAP
jgi:N-acyl-L-homoserine lactone synthetase